MVTLNKIYTRTGDDGTTGLSTGDRLPKHSLRVCAYGTVDETNAVIGIARLYAKSVPKIDAMLARIQNDLFDLGADLATPDDPKAEFEPLRILDHQVDRLETEIDELNERLEPLRSFVLPGGSALAAHLHLARTVARRAEREMTALAAEGEVGSAAIRYVNRVSDLLFVMARIANDEGHSDVLWVPGANR